MISAFDYQKKSPEWTLAKFFEAWQKREWKKMLKFCQYSWVKAQKNPDHILLKNFKNKLIDATIINIKKVGDVTTDISVEIICKDINIKKKIKRKARLVCEKGYLQPSPNGKWGVNPTSMTYERE